jgi:all-trans-nonaprenyl-diphosphate synthase
MDNLKNIIHPIKDDIDIFEENLKNVIAQCDNFLREDILNFMFSNPKRLRPIFIFLFSKILNITSPLIQKIALVSELIHSASLIHDDIIDEADLRREFPSLNAKYGAKIAVLEGDLLLSLALNILSDTTIEISKIYSNRIIKTILGELEQDKNLYNKTTVEDYIEKTFNKTGNLFLAGLEALFTLSNRNENLFNFMKNYSIYFQLKNDIKDITSDAKLGNYTLVMLYFLKDYKIEDIDKVNLDKYINLANEKIKYYKEKALLDLNLVQNSEYKDTLLKIIDLGL